MENMSYVTANDGKKIWYDVVGNGEPLVLIGEAALFVGNGTLCCRSFKTISR